MVLVCTIILLAVLAFLVRTFSKNSFQYNTYINGVECSFLTVNSAKNKLEQNINNSEITLIFADDKEYTCLAAYFEIEVADEEELRKIILAQAMGETDEKEYDIENLYSVNEEIVEDYLSSLSVFNESNIRSPENAYLELNDDNQLVIQEEQYGNELSLEAAYEYMISALEAGETVIDFTGITNITPDILSTDEELIAEKDYINSILSTTIEYELYDGSTYVLDADVMKEWIYRGDDGYYSIDIDGNLPQFVEELNTKATYKLTSTKFNATDEGEISISFGTARYATINTDEEIERIKERLGTEGKVTFDPIYNPLPDYLNIDTYVEIDLTRQKVWMYVDGECIVETDCVTGSVSEGYATPVGIYYLTYKTTDTYLEGYNGDGTEYSSHVDYWMPFNGDIGLHDASWRTTFGGSIYLTNGSHGCINLPYSAAKTIYNNIDSSMPIILYSS